MGARPHGPVSGATHFGTQQPFAAPLAATPSEAPRAGQLPWWVDYNRGLIFCDVNRPSPKLQYLALPLGHVPIGYPDCFKIGYLGACRAVCITKGGKMKFINVVRADGKLSGWRMSDSCCTIKIFTLMHNSCDDMEWKDEVKITATEFWAMDGYDDQLPRIVLEFPLLSMDDPDIIYLVLKERRSPAAKTWVVTLDMVRMIVVSSKISQVFHKRIP